jgi:8-oxo-dGTP pyrophosphatase MutT (NUDIX family)
MPDSEMFSYDYSSCVRPLIQLIADYTAVNEQDLLIKGRFESFLKHGADCFLRDNQLDGHITGSAWLVDNSLRRVLLTHHRKLDRWLQLGGHADGECDALTVALKEAREESGIESISPYSAQILDLDIHVIPERGAEAEHLHYDVRFALVAESTNFEVSHESNELAWVEIDSLSLWYQGGDVLRSKEQTGEGIVVDTSLFKLCQKWKRWLEEVKST